MQKSSILFPISNKVELDIMESKIMKTTGWKKWSKPSDTNCFCGLNYDTVVKDGVSYNRILVVWTDDGINTYERELPSPDLDKITGVIDTHGN